LTLYLLDAIIVIVMWELTKLTSRGGVSTRRIFTYALAAIIAVFLWTILLAPQTHAADPATWNGDTITYSGNQYFNSGKAKAGDSVNLPVDTAYYTHIETVNTNPLTQKAYVIYFAPGQDPGATTTARYVTYDFANKTYSNPQGDQSIAIGPNNVINQVSSSCAVPGGLGWIICPASVTISAGMDWILGVISSFMQVQPASVGDSHNVMFVAWNLMRSFANVAFIIVFLIIIYSQLANVGISNYGIKKLLPRLIIAAVLVNISYYMCAIAIDLSNVIGYSIQDFFANIQTSLTNTGNGTMNASIWNTQSITEFVLSGGTAAVAGAGGLLIATGGSIASAIFLLLPVLVGLFLAVLVAFLILAARQALIVVLLIISPLAFVANLLPNTEKWFTEWRKLFTTMLVFFPAFAVVFAGAQLAGNVIVQNAASINIVILGLIVKLAPLAISPLLLKLSGSFLGKIAALANTPNKLIKDRTKQWSDKRADFYKQRALGSDLKPHNVFKRTARSLAYRNHRVERGTERWKQGFEEYTTKRDMTDRAGQKIEVDSALSKLNTEKMQSDLKLAVEELRGGSTAGLTRLREQAEDTGFERIRNRVLDTKKSNRFDAVGRAALSRAVMLDQETRSIAQATHSAQEEQQQNYAVALSKNIALQVQAGGISDHGADSALAAAISTIREAYNKSVSEARAINKHFELSSTERQLHAEGQTITKTRADGAVRIFDSHSTFTREAAIEDQMTTGTVEEVERLIKLSGTDAFKEFRATIADTMGKNSGMQAKALHIAGQSIDDIAQGRVVGEEGLNWVTARAIARGKLSEKEVVALDPTAIARFLEVATDSTRTKGRADLSATDRGNLDRRIIEFSEVVRKSFSGEEKGAIKSGARDDLVRIARISDPNFNPDDLSVDDA
jgi:hypothetical protein